MLKVQFKKINTKFRNPFTTSYETKTQQEALLVSIAYNGIRGIGEAPAISYYDISVEKMIIDLQEKAQELEKYAITEPARFWHFCHHLFPDNPFLVCALDLAYWDLYTQIEKKTIPQILEIEQQKAVPTFFTMTTNNKAGDFDKLEPHPWDSLEPHPWNALQPHPWDSLEPDPWDNYKIKINNEESFYMLRWMKQKFPKSKFAVDINAAWSLEEAKKYIPALQKFGVLFIEQPLAKDNFKEMKLLKEEFDVPFFADESFQTEKDLEKCAESFDGINIKLTKCSGLSPAFLILQKAKKQGLKTMLGCMNETEIGIYPAAQLGGITDYNDLDGALLLDTPLKKLRYENSQIIFNQF